MKFFSLRINRIRTWIILFMAGLVLSGLSAIPLEWELGILQPWFGSGSRVEGFLPEFSAWIDRVSEGIRIGYGTYPFLAYGTDWLAFGHVAIALAFLGPLRDPVKNRWVIEFGMLACLLVVPWAVVFSLVRGIPWFWTLIDMSFGVVGIVPLWLAHHEMLALAREGSQREKGE
jgi:hypothetical protein